MPIWRRNRFMPSSSCVSSSSRSGTGTTERGLLEPMLELEELKLVVEVFEVSGFLESLEPVDSFVFSDSFALSSPLIYILRTKIKLVQNRLYANLKQASRLPWRPVRSDHLCATGGRGGLALPTVFAPLRVYRPKSRITDRPRAQELRGFCGIQILSLS